ncbi:MAG: tRNA pseudouridine(55) synthase TruB [Pseudomonadota bacterium]|nr:tRNA pseudouridine(55) synthase TruB [Pseudomonadota bacterium]
MTMPLQNSILLLDKPLGLSSNAALQKVRHLFGKPVFGKSVSAKPRPKEPALEKPKAGHAGTLDPLATGMLPICLGEATKFAGYLLTESKCYQTRVALGIETISGDRDGEQVATADVPRLDAKVIEAAVLRFVGNIRQTPPIYSAIKQDGVALYKRARAGEVVQAKEREVSVKRIDLIGFGVDYFELEIECGSGTYIRTLGMDIARALGSVGHLAALRRSWVSPFQHCAMASIQDVSEWCESARINAVDPGQPPAWLLPIEHALSDLAVIDLDAAATLAVKQGRGQPSCGQNAGQYRLHDAQGRFFGLGRVDESGLLRAKRLLATDDCG